MSDIVNPIISEEYADLLIPKNDIEDMLQIFPDAIVTPINYIISLLNIPVSYITNQTISRLGYGLFPGYLGLVGKESLEASGITKLRGIPALNLRGEGVLIGILDTGIDYTNPIFQYPDGTTRIVSIWDQTIQSENQPEGFLYGTEYTREQINLALQSENPFDIVPTRDENGHGTMIAGIAGGNEVPEKDFYGIASQAEFVVVKLKTAKKYFKEFYFILEDAVVYQENDFSFALEYLLAVAAKLSRPMTIGIAISSFEGPHDGRGDLSTYLSLIAATPGIACTLPAGNEGIARRHYFGMPDAKTRSNIVELNVGENAHSFTMQLWGKRPNIYSVDIISPSGEYVPRLIYSINEFREISFIFEKTVIYLDYQFMESQSSDPFIMFRFKDPDPGIWKINVYEVGDIKYGFHIWLPMEGFVSDNIFFIQPDPYMTVLSLSTNPTAIVATAYDYTDDSLFKEASKGYTRAGDINPQLAAPGVNVIGPTLEHSFTPYSGTSISSAYTAGVAAMLLEWGIVQGNLPNMSTVDMRILLIRGARRLKGVEYPNREWGYGILDIYNVFDSLRTKG
ncbi:S8 family peptidase [Anaeromicropila populeti]|uniref:Subtilase family protein n=1 Tax=Anaeromicropila populeti TaxID=37658 RepID=A0A1I6ISQ7_9FIRM|nr:S8 family peptidase [Anaeromicropila populeti]SFR69753.1 Subtilase family protein [Anaeromicropila populeti]